MFGGIVLAAGASSRLGSPKALVRVAGKPAVLRACEQLRDAGCKEIRVVLGGDREAIRAAVPPFAKVVDHAAWERGRTSSIKAGLSTLDRQCCTLLWPIDHPLIETETLSRLLDGPSDIRIPTFEGRRGHPTLFESNLRDEILALGDDEPLHAVVHRDPARVVEVPVTDPGVLLNVDTPDDLKKLGALEARSRHARPTS